MLAEEPFQRLALRQVTGVPQHDLVFVNADLDRDAAAVVLVNDGIQQSFTQRTIGIQEGLHSLQALVADVSLQILRVQQLQSLLHLLEQVPVNLVLIPKVVVGHEEPDLDPGSADNLFRPVGEQQAGGPF